MKEVGKIKDACIVIAGQSPKGTSYNENGEGMEFHQGKKAFGESIIESSNVWTTEITKIAEPGDILMSVRAPVGPTNITDRKICIGRGLAAIRCKGDVIPQYILYALRNIESKIIGNDGAVFNSINKKQIEDLPLPLLSLPEQQSIVEYLDSAFAKIDTMKANAEKALNEAQALFQASLKEMLEPKEGWEKKTIKYFAKIVHGKNQKEVLDDNGSYPIYGSGSNIMGYANSYLCDAGATILGRKGTIDNPLYIEEKFWNVDTAFGIIAKENCNKKFLYYSIKKIKWAKLNTGTTLPSLTQNVVYNVEMSAPSISEQQSIVATLDSLKSKVDRLQANSDKISQECDALKQAILKQVFE